MYFGIRPVIVLNEYPWMSFSLMCVRGEQRDFMDLMDTIFLYGLQFSVYISIIFGHTLFACILCV